MRHSFALLLVLSAQGAFSFGADHDESTFRAVYETEIEAPVADVWRAFTTSEGLRAWMAPLADVELAVGGKMRANYQSDGVLGDDHTIENTILCYDPRRMLALRATKFPAGFPFVNAARETWSVFYFDALEKDRTKITVVGLGYTEEPESQRMRSFFATSNAQVLDALATVMEGKGKGPPERPSEPQ